MKLITLKAFDTAIEAYILKNKLEGEGVMCYIFDENIVTLNPMLNFAVGGIRLQVETVDYNKAMGILAELNEQPYTDNENQIIKCPKCGSHRFYSDFKSMKDPKGFFAMLAAFIFSVFPLYSKSVNKCKDCNTEFNKK
jgi:DNA-directed RNA polymerase subunit RPC12/RpoP